MTGRSRRRSHAAALGAVWLALAGVGIARAQPARLDPPPATPTARELAERVEQTFRGNSGFLDATMVVTSPRLPEPRRVRFQSWDDRAGKRSFIRILEPSKDRGTAFLKLPPNLWSYVPRVERTIRIPPSMMLQSWMGSDFTNDDLVRESSVIDDYEHRWLGVDPSYQGARAYVIEYRPHEGAPVVWGRIVAWVDPAKLAPLRQEYYDEAGVKLRVMTMSEFRDEGGRPYPHHWSMVPLDKPGHETAIEVNAIRFDEKFDEEIFTQRNLTRRE
jgi:outer membrane lipoprotein-sorting protein